MRMTPNSPSVWAKVSASAGDEPRPGERQLDAAERLPVREPADPRRLAHIPGMASKARCRGWIANGRLAISEAIRMPVKEKTSGSPKSRGQRTARAPIPARSDEQIVAEHRRRQHQRQHDRRFDQALAAEAAPTPASVPATIAIGRMRTHVQNASLSESAECRPVHGALCSRSALQGTVKPYFSNTARASALLQEGGEGLARTAPAPLISAMP